MTDETGSGQTRESGEISVTPNDGLRQLSEYIEGARWFGGKGRGLRVTGARRVGVIADEGPRVVVDLVAVAYEDGDAELYQVPLVLYTHPEHRLDHAFVGWWQDPDVGWTHAYDAVHDREAMAAYLRAFAYPPDGPLTFHRVPGEELDPTAPSTPFTGEQSNSSVAFGEQALLKIFRRVTPGTNPDIEIHEKLTLAGSDNVAALLGWIECDADGSRRAQNALLNFRRSSSWRCCSSSCGPPATGGSWRSRRCATCSPRLICSPTRSAVTSRPRRSGWARRWGTSTSCSPSTSRPPSARRPTTPSSPRR